MVANDGGYGQESEARESKIGTPRREQPISGNETPFQARGLRIRLFWQVVGKQRSCQVAAVEAASAVILKETYSVRAVSATRFVTAE